MGTILRTGGAQGVTELCAGRRYSVTGGWSTRRKFHGPPEQIDALAAALAQAGYDCDVEPVEGRPISVLVAVAQDAVDGSDAGESRPFIWMLDYSSVQLALWEHPNVEDELTSLTDAQMGEFRRLIERLQSPEQPTSYPAFLAGKPQLTVMARKVTRGVDYFFTSRPVLTASKVVPANTSVRASMLNINKVYTTAELQAAEQIPSTILWEMPAGEWLKAAPDVKQMNDGKFQIQQEWTWNRKWDTWLCERAT